MKYDNLKGDILKEDKDSKEIKKKGLKDKDSKEIKKKGLKSLLANVVVKNNNPDNGDLRVKDPASDQDIHKSFFNLVWKTILRGMKETLGLA
jgi:hypothetical protein